MLVHRGEEYSRNMSSTHRKSEDSPKVQPSGNAIAPIQRRNLTEYSGLTSPGVQDRSHFVDPLASFTSPGRENQQLLSLHQLRQRRSQLLQQQRERNNRYMASASLPLNTLGIPLHSIALAPVPHPVLLYPVSAGIPQYLNPHPSGAAVLLQEEAMALASLNQQPRTSGELSLLQATANDLNREAAEREEAKRNGVAIVPPAAEAEDADEDPAGEDEEKPAPYSQPYKRETWDVMYERLLQYKQKHGHCVVPQDYKQIPKLGNWVQKQRTLKKSDKLAADRIEHLDAVGFIWRVQESWESMFEQLKQYKLQNGHCNVPKHFDENPKLGKWVRVQKMRRKVLSDERRELLNSIGMENFW